jgi:hypothetical protein
MVFAAFVRPATRFFNEEDNMIIRKETNGGLTIIPQTAHSLFVGQMAAHWGNRDFETPQPFESVARAAAYHDYGHLNWEPDLPFDAATGEPLEFRKLPDIDRQLRAYQGCIEWMNEIDPYSGLLVSMHQTGLRRKRYDLIAHPVNSIPASPYPPVEQFIVHNEARQEQAQQQLEPDEVWTNYHLLQVWDLLGLYFTCEEPVDDYIDPVPMGYGKNSARAAMSMKVVGKGKIAFDPYPFDQRPLKVQIACKRLTQSTFPDQASYRKAYFQAPNELLEYELIGM